MCFVDFPLFGLLCLSSISLSKASTRPMIFLMPGAICILLFLQIEKRTAKVIGAAVIPHGDFAFDPSLVDNNPSAVVMNKACVDLGKKISSLKPGVIVLSTPHGQALDNLFAVYGNTFLSGYAPIGQDLNDENHTNYYIRLNATSSPQLAEYLVSSVASPNVSLLVSWGDSDPSPLRWGEVIPMSFLNDTLFQTQFVVMSQPSKRYTESKTMVDELQTIGSDLYEALEVLDMSAMLVISSDLAHTHLESSPYGYSPAAKPFDEAVVKWGSTLIDDYLLVEAKALVDNALSCGWTGLVMLNGFLKAGIEKGCPFISNVQAYSCPTYYGMMLASYFPDDSCY